MIKKSRFSETQIVSVLKDGEARRAVAEICGESSIPESTYLIWRANYGRLNVSDNSRIDQFGDLLMTVI